MRTSDSIAKISEALAAAQAEIQNPVKDRTARVKSDKADYTYNYADLSSVLDSVRPVLGRHGIAIVQAPEVPNPTTLAMHTRLVHASGEWIETTLTSEIDPQAKIQTLGSAITYLRRYALQAIAGVVAEEDDDGNAAQGSQATTARREPANGRQPTASRAAPAQQPAHAAAPAAGVSGPTAPGPQPLSEEQRYDAACEAINERLGSAAGHKLIMSMRAKFGGETMTAAQKTLLLKELERTVATGEAVGAR